MLSRGSSFSIYRCFSTKPAPARAAASALPEKKRAPAETEMRLDLPLQKDYVDVSGKPLTFSCYPAIVPPPYYPGGMGLGTNYLYAKSHVKIRFNRNAWGGSFTIQTLTYNRKTILSTRRDGVSAPGYEIFLFNGCVGIALCDAQSQNLFKFVHKNPINDGRLHNISFKFDYTAANGVTFTFTCDGITKTRGNLPWVDATTTNPLAIGANSSGMSHSSDNMVLGKVTLKCKPIQP